MVFGFQIYVILRQFEKIIKNINLFQHLSQSIVQLHFIIKLINTLFTFKWKLIILPVLDLIEHVFELTDEFLIMIRPLVHIHAQCMTAIERIERQVAKVRVDGERALLFD